MNQPMPGMINSRSGFVIGVFAVAIAILALWISNFDRLSLGGDEGMEMSKVLLLKQQPHLLPATWNDQPWLFTKILVACGGTIETARLLVGLCSLVGFASMASLLAPMSPTQCVVLATLWLVGPTTLILSVAAMPEMPAVSFALLSAAILPRSWQGRALLRCFLSGLVYALSLHLKLTSILFLPALLAHFSILFSDTASGLRMLRGAAVLCCGFAVGWTALLFASPDWSLQRLVLSHWNAGQTPQAENFGFSTGFLFVTAPGSVLAAALGFYVLIKKRDFRRATFPITLLATATVVHTFHRPFWFYYFLHFAYPMAILGSVLAGSIETNDPQPEIDPSPSGVIKSRIFGLQDLLTCFIVSLLACVELPRIPMFMPGGDLRDNRRQNSIVSFIRTHSSLLHWGYGRNSIYLNAGGVLSPPELAVIPKKRLWTRALTEEKIVELVSRYSCEVLLLEPDQIADRKWTTLINNRYTRVLTTKDNVLFIRKGILPPVESNSTQYLNRLGL